MEQFNKWLTWALLIGVFAVPFIPFIVSTTYFFPFITGKNFAFRILVELLLGVFIILALRDPAYRPRFSWIGVGVLALTLVSILATVFSIDPVKSFWSNFERMEGLVGLLHLAAWFFIVGVTLNTEKLWNRFLQVSIGASVIMGIYVCLQIGGAFTINQGGVRTDGTFGNAIYLAVYMLFHIFFTFLIMIRHRGPRWVQVLYVLALLLQFVGLYFAATRSATLGAIGGLLITSLGIALFEKENKTLRRVAIGGICAVVILVGGFFAIRTTQMVMNSPVLSRFASISAQDGSTRFVIWAMAFKGLEEHPILGWGQENFNFVFNKYYNPEMWSQEQWFDRAHNAYIDWAISAGLLGLLAFIALFICAALAFMRSRELSVAERAILMGLLCAYAFHSLFVFDNLMSSVYFFVLLALAYSLSRKELPRAMFLTKPMNSGAFAVTAPVVAIVTVCCVYFLNAPGMATAGVLIDALTPQKEAVDASGKMSVVQKDPKENLASFKLATENSALGKQEAIEQLLQISSSAVSAEGIDPAVKQGFVSLAIEKGAQLLVTRPNDARLELFYGSFLNTAGKTEEGRTHLVKAHELSPAKQTIAFELGINSYLRSGDVTNALTVIKQAYDSDPTYPDAAIYYALALLYAGRQDTADQVLTKTFGTVLVDDDRVVSVYTDGKLFERVFGIWQARIKKNPSDPQLRVSFASALKNAGQDAQAIAVLRQSIQDFPQYTTQFNDAARQLGISL